MCEKTKAGIVGSLFCLFLFTAFAKGESQDKLDHSLTDKANTGEKSRPAQSRSKPVESGKKKPPAPKQGTAWIVPDFGMEFVWVKQLSLWVGKYEVTNAEYRMFKPRHDSGEYKGHTLNKDRQPVVFIRFEDAQEYARWLTRRERDAGRLPSGYHYRLPTKDEWKSACQCEGKSKFPWGDEWPPKSGDAGNYSDRSSAWWNKISDYDDGFPVTCPVEKSWKNKWGLYGMSGNVWECTTTSEASPQFQSWMGASWYNCDENDLHPWSHIDHSQSFRNPTFGFRLILCPLKTH